MKLIYVRLLIVVSLVASLGLTQVTLAADSGEERRVVPKSTQDLPWGPEIVFSVKDGKYLNTLVEKNTWYQKFRQAGIYQGLVSQMGPVIFGAADDHGASKGQWKGRLIDYLYSKAIEGHPVRLAYFSRAGLQSPFAFSVKGLSKGEVATLEALIKALRSMPDQMIALNKTQEVSVTPIRVKQQKFAVVLKDGCLTVGRAPKTVGVESYFCRSEGKISQDAQVSLSVSEFMPAVKGVADKWLGLGPQVVADFRWESSGARFVPVATRVALKKDGHVVLNQKVTEEILSAIPADSLFYAVGQLPRPNRGWTIEALEAFYSSPLIEQRRAGPMSVGLTYVSVGDRIRQPKKPVQIPEAPAEDERREGRADPTAAVLLVQIVGPTAGLVSQFAELFNEKTIHEVYVRPVCRSVMAVTNSMQALELIQATCDGKSPSLKQLEEKRLAALTQKPMSGALFVSPGRWLSNQIQEGWRQKNKSESLPSELEASRKLLEELPSFLYVGSAESNNLTLTSIQQ